MRSINGGLGGDGGSIVIDIIGSETDCYHGKGLNWLWLCCQDEWCESVRDDDGWWWLVRKMGWRKEFEDGNFGVVWNQSEQIMRNNSYAKNSQRKFGVPKRILHQFCTNYLDLSVVNFFTSGAPGLWRWCPFQRGSAYHQHATSTTVTSVLGSHLLKWCLHCDSYLWSPSWCRGWRSANEPATSTQYMDCTAISHCHSLGVIGPYHFPGMVSFVLTFSDWAMARG